jgi:hypothetical protein
MESIHSEEQRRTHWGFTKRPLDPPRTAGGVNYAIVYRIGSLFSSPRSPDELRGLKPDELWIFGEPKSDQDREFANVIEPVAQMWRLKTHRISAPNREVSGSPRG